MYADVDADTVRVWDEDLCLLEVKAHETTGYWDYTGSDVGFRYDIALMDEKSYEHWKDAVHAFGLEAVL